jgi:serine/threonine protein phosphatase 1
MHYAVGDIHGCYDELMELLKVIDFKDSDMLLLVGDFVDRGPDTRKCLQFIENRPENVIAVRGNHDEGFIAYVNMMIKEAIIYLNYDYDKYDRCFADNYFSRKIYGITAGSDDYGSEFDYYGTLDDLVMDQNVTLSDLIRWSDKLSTLPYYHKFSVDGKKYCLVHAGYTDDRSVIGKTFGKETFNSMEEFYIYAREAGIKHGNFPDGTVLAGHTPTIIDTRFTFNDGRIFHHHDDKKNTDYYDLDCGCVFHYYGSEGHLAALRLEDLKEFYVPE